MERTSSYELKRDAGQKVCFEFLWKMHDTAKLNVGGMKVTHT